jgi:hypothetical protein
VFPSALHTGAPHNHAVLCDCPTQALGRIGLLADDLRSLDEAIRRELLSKSNPARGSKPADDLTLGVTQTLRHGGFTAVEIAELVDDGGEGTNEARAKRVYDRFLIRRNVRSRWANTDD